MDQNTIKKQKYKQITKSVELSMECVQRWQHIQHMTFTSFLYLSLLILIKYQKVLWFFYSSFSCKWYSSCLAKGPQNILKLKSMDQNSSFNSTLKLKAPQTKIPPLTFFVKFVNVVVGKKKLLQNTQNWIKVLPLLLQVLACMLNTYADCQQLSTILVMRTNSPYILSSSYWKRKDSTGTNINVAESSLLLRCILHASLGSEYTSGIYDWKVYHDLSISFLRLYHDTNRPANKRCGYGQFRMQQRCMQ